MSAVLAAEVMPPTTAARAIARSVGSLVSCLAAALSLGAIAVANGGYFPAAWGWAALGLGWLAAMALLLRRNATVGAAEIALILGLLALTVWSALSQMWSLSAGASLGEVQRTAVYLLAALAFASCATPQRVRVLIGGVVGAAGIVSVYALATRLFPARLEKLTSVSDYRLFAPIGYANGLGAFVAIALLLAVGLALRGQSRSGRCISAALLPVLATAQYFTFSRGADLALGCGLVIAVAVDKRRLQLTAGLAVLAAPVALAVWLGATSPALVHVPTQLAEVTREGRRLGLALVVLSVACGVLVLWLRCAEDRVTLGLGVRRAFAIGLTAASLAAAITIITMAGGPVELARGAWRSFSAPARVTTDLNHSLLSLSGAGRIDAWRVALEDFAAHPLLGSGAGTYEGYWNMHRPSAISLKDAHSLYLETLAELGAVGLLVLLVAVGAPLAVLRRVRGHPLACTAAGAYGAYLIHTAVDWDWEVPAVTLAGLLAGLMLVLMSREHARPLTVRLHARVGALGAVLATAAFALVGLVGNTAASASARALASRHWLAAQADAREAALWEPWSAEPWRLMAQVSYQQGDLGGAVRYLHAAIARDPRNWQLWSQLGFTLNGNAADEAFDRARQLNPRTAQIPRPESLR